MAAYPEAGPPQSIPIGSGGGMGGGNPGGPDTPEVGALIEQAAELLSQALAGEKDPEDKALISKMVDACHQFAGKQQKMLDQVTGAGPGVKVLRKAGQ